MTAKFGERLACFGIVGTDEHFDVAVVADDPCHLVAVDGVELRERLQDEEKADAARTGDGDHVRHALEFRQVPKLIEDEVAAAL